MGKLRKMAGKMFLEVTLASRSLGRASRAADASLTQWAVVGPGYMGETFARALARHDGSNVALVFSRSAQRGARFAGRHGAVASFDDLDAFAEECRRRGCVAYVATPLGSHREIVELLLGRGVDVLCEKPLCETRVGAEALYALADANRVRLFEGMWLRCLPTYRKAMEWVRSGAIGDVARVEASMLKDEPAAKKGVLSDCGVYALAFAVGFLPASGYSCDVFRDDRADGTDCAWRVAGEGGGGASLDLAISACGAGESSAQVVGSKGSVYFRPQFNRTNTVELRNALGEVIERASFDYISEGFEHEIADVEAAVRNGAESALRSHLALETIGLMEGLLTLGEGKSRLEFELGVRRG